VIQIAIRFHLLGISHALTFAPYSTVRLWAVAHLLEQSVSAPLWTFALPCPKTAFGSVGAHSS
jgi:hypothetical protein